jgi:hypothetical protein
MACSEGGGVEIDGGSATMTKSLRKRTTAAQSEAGVEAVACSGARIGDGRWQRNMAVSRATAERESARGQNFAKCGEREHMPKILVWGHNARRIPTTRVSLFLVLEMRLLVARLSFYCKGRRAGSSASCIDTKARRAPNGHISFQLASSSIV